ncbi:hypothetical protein PHYBLDRAFT_144188 [Phycomyces blakesleeanus NRRL 1555(-)]|uniref:Uncharacterized protein n=1 Tax=Phycomyces blakesleeanus (strain ATCC 8743b / DSM 1359 / FGSC 10004 / NBRC 33097 / NRRL 1555) TaxID=763407 RepID=A0A162NJN2_PHYB8|nr:hypothetical protein PHYBLDRAFT_144188 [Phycomyces blakesleeanus NRRL 1555(-)]OAD74828.1 hypothetical protein PHYBLDRAFT_144188 [Phycomyces blakesleeanus NRRL 1555(-)]|eukprot:XP_018292868.1 hypothetical protein PHYBLDRAFT_144188 [Phycomyces blakesleeanus NRRL 1555(-)]
MLYLLTTSSGFNLKTFIDSAEVTINNVKGNETLPPFTFPFGLGKFVQMQEDKYAHLLKYYRMSYCDASLRGYQEVIFVMFYEINNHRRSTFTSQIQYIFVNNIINPVTYQVDRHIFAYVKYYRTSSQDTRSKQFVEISKFAFTRNDFQNSLPVHCILMSAANGVYTTATGNTHMLIAPLYRKIYT